jgi:hypothetical protein
VNISQNKCEIFTFSLGYRLAKMAYLPGLIEKLPVNHTKGLFEFFLKFFEKGVPIID